MQIAFCSTSVKTRIICNNLVYNFSYSDETLFYQRDQKLFLFFFEITAVNIVLFLLSYCRWTIAWASCLANSTISTIKDLFIFYFIDSEDAIFSLLLKSGQMFFHTPFYIHKFLFIFAAAFMIL